MSHSSQHRVAAVLLASVWLCGCSSLLAPQRDVSRFYTLSAVVEAGGHDEANSPGPLYGLGPIALPPYLDRNALALRVSPAEVTYSEADLWAEPLQTNLTRVVQQNLSALLGTDRIVLYPWPRTVPVAYQIIVNVLHCERAAAGEARLQARWSIRDPRSGDYLMTRESNIVHTAASPSVADGVNALSTDVGDLSREIASALRSLPVPQTAAPGGKKRTVKNDR